MLIYDHIEVGSVLANKLNKKMYHGLYGISKKDKWIIEECSDIIKFYTVVDNFDMLWFLENIGVKNEYIQSREI